MFSIPPKLVGLLVVGFFFFNSRLSKYDKPAYPSPLAFLLLSLEFYLFRIALSFLSGCLIYDPVSGWMNSRWPADTHRAHKYNPRATSGYGVTVISEAEFSINVVTLVRTHNAQRGNKYPCNQFVHPKQLYKCPLVANEGWDKRMEPRVEPGPPSKVPIKITNL